MYQACMHTCCWLLRNSCNLGYLKSVHVHLLQKVYNLGIYINICVLLYLTGYACGAALCGFFGFLFVTMNDINWEQLHWLVYLDFVDVAIIFPSISIAYNFLILKLHPTSTPWMLFLEQLVIKHHFSVFIIIAL